MKSVIIFAVLLISMISYAGGEVIVKPYQKVGSEKTSLLVGLSSDKKLLGPIMWTNFVGINEDHVEGADHSLADIHFNNGIAFKPMDKLHLELGLELHKDVEDKSPISETVYGKLKVKAW